MRKAEDAAVTDAERSALLAKAAEMGATTAGANPPGKPPQRPRVAAASHGDDWVCGTGWIAYGSSTAGTTSTTTFTTRFH